MPSRWSDFEHFTDLGKQLKAQTLTFFTMEKTLPDLQISMLFFGSWLGPLSAVLLLIAHARLRAFARVYFSLGREAAAMDTQAWNEPALWG